MYKIKAYGEYSMHQRPIALSRKKLKTSNSDRHLSIKGFSLNYLFYNKSNKKYAFMLNVINKKKDAHKY